MPVYHMHLPSKGISKWSLTYQHIHFFLQNGKFRNNLQKVRNVLKNRKLSSIIIRRNLRRMAKIFFTLIDISAT